MYINDEDGIYKYIVCVLHFIQHIRMYVCSYVCTVSVYSIHVHILQYVCMYVVCMYVCTVHVLVRVIGTYVCCTQVEVPVEQLSM